MFLDKEELKTHLYDYQLEQITEGDDTIIEMAIAAAIEEAESYIRQNNKADVNDGRSKYDVDAVFATTGTQRSPMLLQIVKTLAVWHIVQLCNADMVYDKVKDRYDRAVTWLKDVSRGNITAKLPLLVVPEPSITDQSMNPWRMGGSAKFNHE